MCAFVLPALPQMLAWEFAFGAPALVWSFTIFRDKFIGIARIRSECETRIARIFKKVRREFRTGADSAGEIADRRKFATRMVFQTERAKQRRNISPDRDRLPRLKSALNSGRELCHLRIRKFFSAELPSPSSGRGARAGRSFHPKSASDRRHPCRRGRVGFLEGNRTVPVR